ncbi:unnamed protein product, partial [marine sediment metagenome]
DGIHLIGDVMLDSFLYFSKIAAEKSKILDDLNISPRKYLVATVHRARNTEVKENLTSIVNSFLDIDERIVFPIHPRTEKYLKQYGLYKSLENAPNMTLIASVGYLDSIILVRNAKKILTDSGGLQKEAYFSKIPCITLDEATGWLETVEDGWNTLVGSDKNRIIKAVRHFQPKGKQSAVFGDGKACEKAVSIISQFG